MKKQLLTLLATLSLTTVPISVLAQENHSSEIESSLVDERTLIEDHEGLYLQHTKDYLALLSNIIHNADAVSSDTKEVDNQLIIDYVEKLNQREVAVEEAMLFGQKLAELTKDKVSIKELITSMDEAGQLSLSQATLFYLEKMKDLLMTDEGEVYSLATDEQIELTWQLVKVAKEYGFVLEDNQEKLKALSLELGAAEFHRLVTTSFNEDGSFKDKLYSKHMTELYNLLKDKKVDFIKVYQERYNSILKEIEARKTASDAVKKIEEKRAKGETVTEEELKQVEVAVSKVQTQSHKEVAKATTEAVVTSQTNNTAYEKSTPKPVEQPKKETPKEKAPSPEPVPTPPVAVAPEPSNPTPPPAPEPIVPAFQPDGVTTFWTFEEADDYGYNYSLTNARNIASYFVMEVPNGDGTSHFALYFEYRQ
ncbi:hypothetical protein NHG25_05295 [Aerococcaceae bacterium NML191292]|nr:hypothetical protein [Aerococcaceae bacterium NML191292]MCW6675465.1 hypothetical protein [Aerococcaceae bacterium NML171108]